jgi:HPt (histidine-containing phosphotransfer) domain-containing protein
MTSPEAQIADLVSALATRFAHRTPTELAGMRESSARLCQGCDDSLQSLKRWSHKVRGTAASIGLADVSACAAEIENLLMGPVVEERLASLLSALEAKLVLAAGHRE